MPLLDFWNAHSSAVEKLSIQQVVATAGNGKLSDGSDCSEELRTFLKQVSSAALSGYLHSCLTDGFKNSGFVLQDLINELGRRLDYDVQNGLYRGSTKRSGHDGLWRAPEGNDLIIEVKTTDAYRISLDTLAKYKRRLIQDKLVDDDASILIVVGREDTGDLEAQVRGSRHAWDIRLISADALLNLQVGLMRNWELARQRKPLEQIPPLT